MIQPRRDPTTPRKAADSPTVGQPGPPREGAPPPAPEAEPRAFALDEAADPEDEEEVEQELARGARRPGVRDPGAPESEGEPAHFRQDEVDYPRGMD